jgi:hypothetical protein
MSREKTRKPGIKKTAIQRGWNGRAVFPAFNFELVTFSRPSLTFPGRFIRIAPGFGCVFSHPFPQGRG